MAEDAVTPVAGAEPPPASPITHHGSTLMLKPVIRKPVIGGASGKRPTIRMGIKLPTQKAANASAASAEAPSSAPSAPTSAPEGGALEQLKSVTQKLKGVTQEIPQQAILHKTGIIADQDLSDAQKQASKSRTARISLSDALGVAPVQNEATPMKTIRIKRPDSVIKSSETQPTVSSDAGTKGEAPATEAQSPSPTQRKTLKISRPGAVRPAGKFGIKKTVAAEPDTPTEATVPPAEGEVVEIPDVPEMPSVPKSAPAASSPSDVIPGVPKVVAILGIIVQLAACVVIGLLGYYLYQDMQLPLFCGGCGWGL